MSASLTRANYLLPTNTNGVVVFIYDGRQCSGQSNDVRAGGYIATVTNRNNPDTWVVSNVIPQLCPGRPYRYGQVEVRWDGQLTNPGINVLYQGSPVNLMNSMNSTPACGNIPNVLLQVPPCPFIPPPAPAPAPAPVPTPSSTSLARDLSSTTWWWILLLFLIIVLLLIWWVYASHH